MTLEELRAVAEIVEKLTNRYRDQDAAHKTALAETRASFNARTGADEKTIEGLRVQVQDMREEIIRVNEAHGKTKVERDRLMAQVQDMRAEMERLSAQLDWERAEIKRLQWENATMHKDAEDGYAEAIKVLGDPIALSKERDALRAEVAALKSQTPKHPVKAGEWAKRIKLHPDGTPAGSVQQVRAILPAGYEMKSGSIWAVDYCEPCDQPATHDTEAGKAAAESVVRTEPVAEEIKVGDMAKVVGASGDLTAQSDIGKIGEVLQLDSMDGTVLLSGGAGWVDHRDVRKVTT